MNQKAIVVTEKGLRNRIQGLRPTHRFMLSVFAIWFLQAVPKWTLAITADGQMSAQIVKMFITPRAEASVQSSVDSVHISHSS